MVKRKSVKLTLKSKKTAFNQKEEWTWGLSVPTSPREKGGWRTDFDTPVYKIYLGVDEDYPEVSVHEIHPKSQPGYRIYPEKMCMLIHPEISAHEILLKHNGNEN